MDYSFRPKKINWTDLLDGNIVMVVVKYYLVPAVPPELETRPGEEAVARAGEAVELQCRATAGQADTGQDDVMKLSSSQARRYRH